MRTNGFVLVFCLLFGLLCSSLAMAALVLSELSFQFNQAALMQLQQNLAAKTRGAAQPSAPDGPLLSLPECPAQFQAWPAHWQRCQLGRHAGQDTTVISPGQVSIIWQIDPTTQGGEL